MSALSQDTRVTPQDGPPAWAGATSGGASGRVGALAGLAFVAIVIVQNALRATTAADPDAGPATVIRHYVDHRSVSQALVVLFAVSGVALALFLGATLARLRRDDGRGLADVGLLGGAGIVAVFSGMVACEIALLVVTGRPAPDRSVVDAIWTLHNGLFAVLDVSLAIATIGIGLGAARAGLAPRPFRFLAPVGAVLLLAGTVWGPEIADGRADPAQGASLLGFLVWLVLVATVSLRIGRD